MNEIKDLNDELIKFAFNFIKTSSMGNSYKIFKLYKIAPAMIPYVIDVWLDSLRMKGLKNICKGYLFYYNFTRFGQEIELS